MHWYRLINMKNNSEKNVTELNIFFITIPTKIFHERIITYHSKQQKFIFKIYDFAFHGCYFEICLRKIRLLLKLRFAARKNSEFWKIMGFSNFRYIKIIRMGNSFVTEVYKSYRIFFYIRWNKILSTHTSYSSST